MKSLNELQQLVTVVAAVNEKENENENELNSDTLRKIRKKKIYEK